MISFCPEREWKRNRIITSRHRLALAQWSSGQQSEGPHSSNFRIWFVQKASGSWECEPDTVDVYKLNLLILASESVFI